MGEGAAPGGQELEVPPQQEQRNPSIAQYFQYSQLSRAVGLGLAFRGAPSGAVDRQQRQQRGAGEHLARGAASRLRREVRRASEREECSNS